ncbi:MAG: dehydrogenase, short-chain alcohol dehydrogenase like protein [Mycobacterium sp.]|nr:dehydrogenase, short-chain alcohol dehydrogenase like protein [Mycobacterium sp.]
MHPPVWVEIGVVLLTKNTAIDYGPSGIRVNVIGQAIAVDGGYTAGRDHGVTELMGLGER